MGGIFGTSHESIANFMESCEEFVREYVACVHGINERTSYVEVCSALTFARSAIGWSGKFMED